jgi:hypothetical protein
MYRHTHLVVSALNVDKLANQFRLDGGNVFAILIVNFQVLQNDR